MNYNIESQLITNNRSYKPLNPQGVVFHATDTRGATAQNERDYFQNHIEAKASATSVIDWTKIINMIPENEQAWHAGPTANSKFLGIELCEPAGNNPAQFQEVYNRAIFMATYLIKKYGWNADDNVFSHNGISQMYHETDHTDPYGYFQRYGKTWNDFIQDIKNAVKSYNYTDTVKEEDVMKEVVLYYGDADIYYGAVALSQDLGCPLMRKSDYESNGYKADKIHYVGGKPNSTRNDTIKDTASLL